MPQKKLKVIFMGTPEFACAPLYALISDPDIDVRAVVTAEDKPVGRDQKLTPPPVKVMAIKNDLTVLQPAKIADNADFISLVKKLRPDFIVVVAFGKILKKDLLEIPKYGCVNLHGSLLPKYRGASPVEEALLNGDEETGVSFIKMTEKLDAGDILLIQRLKIDPKDNALILREKLSILGARLLPFLLKDIVEGIITPIPQDEKKVSRCRKIKKEDGLIDLASMSAQEIVNRIRAYMPWPQCHILLNGKRFKILEATLEESANAPAPGKIIVTDDRLLMGTKNGILLPNKVQMEGKSPMDVQDFLRGNSNLFR
jgi:methionyl-tRNA formyltransferase